MTESPGAGIANSCPVCQARFRGSATCPRCGADLRPLMSLTAKAWQLRQAARQAIENSEFERAHACAGEAQTIQSTASGDALCLLSSYLKGGPAQTIGTGAEETFEGSAHGENRTDDRA